VKKVLIIEDNLDLRENTAEILQLAGYEVETAGNGKEGVKLATTNRPDVIVCDIMMPELDGFGVKQLLSQNFITKDIPFIYLTAKAEKTDFRKGMNMGADDYLTKPFDEADLLHSIKLRFDKLDAVQKGFSLSGFNFTTLLEKAIENKKPTVFPKKDTLFREFDKAYHIFYIKSGKVKSYKINDDGKEFLFEIFATGDIIGLWDVLKGSNYFVNASTLEEVEAYRISRDELQRLLQYNFEAAGNLIEMMSEEIKEKEEKMVQLAYDTVRMRVATALNTLYDLYQKEHNVDSFKVAREDLAAMVGTSTESVIRTLSDFKKEGLINISSNEISIKDSQALKNFRY
jgi:CRP/FNR family transcriptional regulator, polysaccharide utilization system transcription regulator